MLQLLNLALEERLLLVQPKRSALILFLFIHARVCNQLIHYYWMQTLSEGRAFVSMLVFSDYQRHKWAYLLQIEDLLQLLRVFGNDSSAVVGMESQWDDKKQDYVVTRSWGL